MNTLVIGGLALLYFGYLVTSKRLDRYSITAPMVFVTAGLVLGPTGLALLNWDTDRELLELVGTVALIVVLFTDASNINLTHLRKRYSIPERLLAIGLPLSILLGAVLAAWILGIDIWLAATLGAILAPTDAALGQAVISNKRIPSRIREALNVESGLNDGIALPFLLFFLSLAGATEGSNTETHWIQFAAMQLTLGPLVGAVIGLIGARAMAWATNRGWMNAPSIRLSALALAVAAYAVADAIGGNGFIAVFIAGMVVGNAIEMLAETVREFAEAEGQMLTSITFFLFAAVIVPIAVIDLSPKVLLYVLLSLTVVRMIPVAISLIGTSLDRTTVLFIGWFGPRGIASVVYVLVAVRELSGEGIETMVTAAVLTVMASVFAHGLSARVLSDRYVHYVEEKIGSGAAEHQPALDAKYH